MARMNENSLPRHLALENVEGFTRSEMRRRLVDLLSNRGFEIQECMLCPTELGVPMRRPRYYLMASRQQPRFPCRRCRCAAAAARRLPGRRRRERHSLRSCMIAGDVLARFGKGFRIVDPKDSQAYTTCFTSGYGRSLMHAGSYLQCEGRGETICTGGNRTVAAFPGGVPLSRQNDPAEEVAPRGKQSLRCCRPESARGVSGSAEPQATTGKTIKFPLCRPDPLRGAAR